MWPAPGEALDRTVLAEQAVENLYREALSRWIPDVRAAVLPTMLTAAAADQQPQEPLPPHTTAVSSTTATGSWGVTTEVVIIAGITLLWSAAVIETMRALGIPLPELPDVPGPAYDERVLKIVDAAVTDMNSAEILQAADMVDADPGLSAARDTVVAAQRVEAANIPAVVQAKVEAAVQAAESPAGAAPSVTEQRAAATQALDPAGETLTGIAQTKSYQTAGLLNNAVITAAQQQNTEFGEQLDKTWIATNDAKTRATHWAADGSRVPIDAKFTVGGAELAYPGDPTGPPEEVYNCRCRLGILAAGEPLPTEVDRHTERLDGRDSTAVNRGGRTQAEEIQRRRDAGNVRARDTADGVGRVASIDVEEYVMTDVVEPDVIDEPEPDFASAITALTAASATAEPRLRTYDPRMFEDPKLTGPTAPTMNNETGRIYGHLAEWGHVIRGGRDVTPRNRNGYRNFHTSQVPLNNGKQLSVGRLTVQGGHASTESGVTAAAARAHYDDVTTAFGLVRVGEDRFGIWFSGVPAPGVDPEVFQQGMTAQLSGDWRDCDGYPLDMIAAHAVNSPGFPIYSAQTGPDGREMALVASLGPQRHAPTQTHVLASVEDMKAAFAEMMAEERERAEAAARLDAALTAAQEAVGDPPPPPTPADEVDELLMRAELVAAVGPGSQMPAQFKKYWLGGAGAAKIGWGRSGDFDRCRKLINAKIMENGQKPLPDHEISGLCASLHREATGARPGHAPGEGGGH
ncbi:Gp8 [Mycolicibacterium canariasense]|uniref:Gp8 n=1 Tax=Mycolicibacterium canariasense TaxID=228230 RepID=A0A124E342_MYCCR|nr:phage minor head protein [Mycolicibacterium canariasense]MCV7210162.1 hypothetical protein [Mycolicibacterium canariasense]ORU97867.1 hypothetical protein AWB94_29380 [Mycolicibacterium canariasense]GAS98810.1 Gp8 [Mycolicibacterium canariasense]